MISQTVYENIVTYLMENFDATSGQMFGKKCIKIGGKAGVALFKEYLVFKLPKKSLEEALSLEGSSLWDPSGKGRAMKEWVQIPLQHRAKFEEYAKSAAEYVAIR